MFEVKLGSTILGTYCISDDYRNYMHRDGEVIYNTCEYWPTREQAQAVLDKFRPVHVWKHADVLQHGLTTMIYLTPSTGPELRSISCECTGRYEPENYLKDATFLFNIKSKLYNGAL